MPQTLSNGPKQLISFASLRTAHIWDIIRTDGVTFRFTDHDRTIEYGGNTYKPTDGIAASASESFQGFKTSNLEFVGILSSSEITEDDLRAGKFRDAQVIETVIDWLYPWAGLIDSRTFWINATTRDSGESWTAEVLGVQSWLSQATGVVVNRSCRLNLGDDVCNADGNTDLSSGQGWLQEGKTVDTIVTNRRRIRSDLTAIVGKNITGINDGWYDRGVLTFTSGFNNGLSFEVQSYIETDGDITLRLPTPFDIAVSDTFDIHPGCDKRGTTCETKFANLTAFGGELFIPGGDSASETP